jgi:histidinol-phosphate aminotransferase
MTLPIKPRPAIERMPSEFGIREGRGKFLRLDYNENTLGCSPAVRAALAKLRAVQIATYPEYGVTRDKLARFFRVSPRQLVLTNGADESLRLIFDAFLDRNQSVFVVDPTFTMYRVYAGLYESQVISLRYDFADGFPLEQACAILAEKKPRAFFLANPNNPTGTLLPAAAIRKLLEAGKETLVAVDEAYFDFSGVTVLPWLEECKNLVVVRTFSKANGLAGLRLGCLCANEETALAFRKAQPPFPVNGAALVAAQAAVRDGKFVRRVVQEIAAARNELERFFTDRGIRCWPSHTNFLLADFGAGAPALLGALEKKRILLRDRTPDFGQPGWVRVTVGSRAQMRRLIRALEELL